MKNTTETTPTTMTTSHSDQEVLFAFKGWLYRWNSDVVTQDDLETQNILLEKLLKGFLTIEKLLAQSDQKAMTAARGNLIPGSNEANEKEVLGMFENQKKSFYQNLKQVSLDLTYVRSLVQNVYEIKNRRSYECFALRAENSKLRAELQRLRNE